MAATKPKRLVEQWAAMTAGPAAVGTSAARPALRPVGVQGCRSRVGDRAWWAGQWHRKHETPIIALHQFEQPPSVRQQSYTGRPMAPKAPVTKEIPSHQRCAEETADHTHNRKADVGDEGETSQRPTRLFQLLRHCRCCSNAEGKKGDCSAIRVNVPHAAGKVNS